MDFVRIHIRILVVHHMFERFQLVVWHLGAMDRRGGRKSLSLGQIDSYRGLTAGFKGTWPSKKMTHQLGQL